MGSRAQRLLSIAAIQNAYGVRMAVEAWDGTRLAEFANANEGASATRVPPSDFGPVCKHGRRLESSGCSICVIEYEMFDQPKPAPLPARPLPPGVYADCEQCQANLKGDNGPRHDGSRFCESYSIAAGGDRAHCTCDSCY